MRHPETISQHLGEDTHVLGAVVPPIFQNTLFVKDDWDEFERSMGSPLGGPYGYSRLSNPTLEVAERKIAALEHADEAKLMASGMAAISAAIVSCVKGGDHVVCVDSVYGPTREFLDGIMRRFGVVTTYVPGEDPEDFVRACRPETSLFVLESPTSIVFRLQDLEAVAAIARARGISTVIDNSYASPLFQNPIDHGIDLVCHTVSKYLGGHSDVVGGVVCGSTERMRALLVSEVANFGGIMSPFNAWLVTRSMRTLALRMRAVQASGHAVASWLQHRPEVDHVFYVGLPEFGQSELRDRQMTGAGGLLTFAPRESSREWARRFTEALRMYQLGVSWGGHESLVVALEYAPMDWPAPRWLVRLYCGLEHVDDMLGDLEQAFVAAR